MVAFYRLIDLAYFVFYAWPSGYLSHWGFIAYRPLLTATGIAAAWGIMRGPGRGYDGMN
ncbi:MAG: hypothetical protein H0W67_09640, partial [Gemmatimonadales bacterium]|nr:hypothetical protein [Gemmatimonadales bacterium]